MSIYNITDITVAGAFCNAMEATWESDRRAAQRRLNSRRDAGENESATTILTVLRGALRRTEETALCEGGAIAAAGLGGWQMG